ncbi:MAG TPA: hypothetical protein VFS21_12085 [Roseiflexaceae bacterium]|nr:hypothetical protein [Roseiflexaceae bacterium]
MIIDEQAEAARVARRFWELAGATPAYPCDPEEALRQARPDSLELTCTGFPGLNVRKINIAMREQGIRLPPIDGPNRAMPGCLLADCGRGYIFYDASAAPPEQRFTKALLLARFLEAYHLPRERALERLGEAIRPVLDGRRPPTLEEQAHALMAGVRLNNLNQLVVRADEPPTSTEALGLQRRIERIACELLAPSALLRQRLRRFVPQVGGLSRLDWLTQLLCEEFGLPEALAQSCARDWIPGQGELTLLDWIQANIKS